MIDDGPTDYIHSIQRIERVLKDTQVIKSVFDNAIDDLVELPNHWHDVAHLYFLALNHPFTEIYTLDILAPKGRVDPKYQMAVISHPDVDPLILETVAMNCSSTDVLKAIVAHPEFGHNAASAIAWNAHADIDIISAVLATGKGNGIDKLHLMQRFKDLTKLGSIL